MRKAMMAMAVLVLAGCGSEATIDPAYPAAPVACDSAESVHVDRLGTLWCSWTCQVSGFYEVDAFHVADGAWVLTSSGGGPCGK